ncbi:hypothetical protein LshimejAT787_0210960 [Lyophyllum shimeji]|uniref:Uncharacterized protein n=1 Tax=Lyophyllum shimeji TaxID=47721 RepID=A0A9P3ULM3_LYOSH|nr:hypothetical protein LshimejAT787_0210960 [Lyophyllum shimeji]
MLSGRPAYKAMREERKQVVKTHHAPPPPYVDRASGIVRKDQTCQRRQYCMIMVDVGRKRGGQEPSAGPESDQASRSITRKRGRKTGKGKWEDDT